LDKKTVVIFAILDSMNPLMDKKALLFFSKLDVLIKKHISFCNYVTMEKQTSL